MAGSSDLGISTGAITDGPARRAVECLLAVALYNFIELVVITHTSFKRRQGLYFWSFVVATWGIAVYSVGFLMRNLSLVRHVAVYGTFIVVGWICMVTGQSVVLWSRMHLLVRNKRTLRTILAMIVVDAIIGHIPTSVVMYGANSSQPDRWLEAYAILERCHVTLFFLQELAISTIYIVETTKLLRTKPSMPRPPIIPVARGGPGKGGRRISSRTKAAEAGRQFLMRLIYINVLVVVLDITIVALEYAGLYVVQTAYKAMVYSVKLKLEYSILNSLVEMTRAYRNARDGIVGSSLLSYYTSRDTTPASERKGKGKQSVSTPLTMTRQAYTPVTKFSRLTQTVDEDGQIRYMSNISTASRVDGGGILQSVHSRPASANDSAQSRGDRGQAENQSPGGDDIIADAYTQFVIQRHRREDWEEKSDLDELVLEGGIQSAMTR